MNEQDEAIRRSWAGNAGAWIEAVREQRIASRRVTDGAIVAAVLDRKPRTVLDLGCGEGWLSRALTGHGITVTGIDDSSALIDAARLLGGGSFQRMSYEDVAGGAALADEPFDVIAANFALLSRELHPLLHALRARVRDDGALIIQTLHPAFAVGDLPYEDAWRTETFSAIDGEWREAMPWYFRTLSSWLQLLGSAGWRVSELREPLDRRSQRPLSLILVALRS